MKKKGGETGSLSIYPRDSEFTGKKLLNLKNIGILLIGEFTLFSSYEVESNCEKLKRQIISQFIFNVNILIQLYFHKFHIRIMLY